MPYGLLHELHGLHGLHGVDGTGWEGLFGIDERDQGENVRGGNEKPKGAGPQGRLVVILERLGNWSADFRSFNRCFGMDFG